ncbi:hypothetical protein VTI28DRAFT_3301 [Corynascus sepedonium]
MDRRTASQRASSNLNYHPKELSPLSPGRLKYRPYVPPCISHACIGYGPYRVLYGNQVTLILHFPAETLALHHCDVEDFKSAPAPSFPGPQTAAQPNEGVVGPRPPVSTASSTPTTNLPATALALLLLYNALAGQFCGHIECRPRLPPAPLHHHTGRHTLTGLPPRE